MIGRVNLGIAAAGLLIAGATPAASGPGESAATMRRAHLAFLVNSDHPRQALLQARSRPSLTQKTDEVVLARALAEYGLIAQAARRYKETGDGSDPRRSQAWLSLARAWYERGRYDKALTATRRVYGKMPDSVARETGPLAGRILLEQGNPEEATAVLRETLERYDNNPVARFNLGVALVRAGYNAEGAGELNEVGRLEESEDRQQKALRDKANLALAYGFLELAQGGTARALFDRVRLDGPYSNRALLGLGWAELAPDGEPQKLATVRNIPCTEDPLRQLSNTSLPVLRRPARPACGPPEKFRDRDEFEIREGANSEIERYKRALVPWTELIERNGSDHAIQEALVAVPYAYRELGAADRAQRGFERAIQRLGARLETVRRVLDRLDNTNTTFPEAATDDDLSPEWLAGHWRLPEADHTAYLAPLAASGDFRLVAQSLRELTTRKRELSADVGTLDELQATVDGFIDSITRNNGSVPETLYAQHDTLSDLTSRLGALRKRLDAQVTDLEQRLRRLARDRVKAYKNQLQAYLKEARRGRAGVYEAASSQGVDRP